MLAAACASALPPAPSPRAPLPFPKTFAQAGDQAAATLTSTFYDGNGGWRACDSDACPSTDQDWGADAGTYALFLRWSTTTDPELAPIFHRLIATSPQYGAPCTAMPCSSWSDVPMWDTIASVREYQATRHQPEALAHARAAFHFVDAAKVFTDGACPDIRYQIAGGRPGYMLKTLETDANYVKAALLLYQATGEHDYLDKAQRQYAAVRRHFLDPVLPLYSVYVYDDGRRCTQLPHRFFASVNGDMVWSGVMLARATRDARYRSEALSTANAVDERLGDARGIFANLQAENDVAEPLVEAMYVLATDEHQGFAARWIERNAQAALAARAADGAFERAWDGPPPVGVVSIWRSNGGLSLEIAAAALQPYARPSRDTGWSHAHFVVRHTRALPDALAFDGAGIAIIGAQGDRCCEAGHARVFVDGVETLDGTGIWQNKSMIGTVPHAVLFAWTWPRAGHHVIRFSPGVLNAKEGGPFLDADGYLVRDR